MTSDDFDLHAWGELAADLARCIREGLDEQDVLRRFPQRLAAAFRAPGAAVALSPNEGSDPPRVGATGTITDIDAQRIAEAAMNEEAGLSRSSRSTEKSREVQIVRGADRVLGAIVLDRSAPLTGPAKAALDGIASVLGAALDASRGRAGRRIREADLAHRDLELSILRELAGKLHTSGSEDELLQTTLSLVLEKLGLKAGWIFVDYAGRGTLELAASRGVAAEFVDTARREGIGTCLCREVFQTGRLQYARNTMECPRLPALVGGDSPMTHACIPLKFDRGVLGVMNIANQPGQLFSAEELRFLETVGHQVCLAVDKERTSRAELRKNTEARALVALARAIGGSLEQERVLSAVGQYASDLLSADRCMIFTGNTPRTMHFAHLSGDPIEGLEPRSTMDFEALGARAITQALQERATLSIGDSLQDPHVNRSLAERWEIGSAVLVPLLSHDKLLGLLVATRRKASSWSDDEVALANALATQAAISIETVNLYGEAQASLVRLQQAQYAMMRNERLATVGTLAASLAHEVRNPLNSINLQLVLLSRRVGRLDDASRGAIVDLVETARREITRLDSLVEEFLSLSTIDRLSLAQANLDEVVSEAVGLMGPLARQKGIGVVEALAGPSTPLRFDREKIKQVLINLMRNAIEAMGDAGTLTISSAALDGAAVVRVADTGSGIEPGLDVFDFFMTTKRGGTGLGLPIAKRIVEAHGGTLGYESVLGEGATFAMTLKTP